MFNQRILDIVDNFNSGKLQRDDYWKEMQQSHLGLLDYCEIVRCGNLDHIEINATEIHIVLKNGIRMVWNPKDIRSAPNVLINHREYEPLELKLLEYFAKSCHTVFDIGANVGWYSLHLACLLEKAGGEVLAFEPVPCTFSNLSRNIQLNGFKDIVHQFNIAFGESNNTVPFYIPNISGSVASSQRQLFPEEDNQCVECQVVTLDAFVTEQKIEKIDLIKCDVEGSELFVLRGGLKTIETCKPIIMLEMLRKWARAFNYHPNEIITILNGLGYRCFSYEGQEFKEIPEIDESCLQTNFFFLHSPTHDKLLFSFN